MQGIKLNMMRKNKNARQQLRKDRENTHQESMETNSN